MESEHVRSTGTKGALSAIVGSFPFETGIVDLDIPTARCRIAEESDTYGFSLTDSSRVQDVDILASFLHDSNWNNPGATRLMCGAYSIRDDYRSFTLPLDSPGPNYLELRGEYNHLIATKSFEHGVQLRNRGNFGDSCKRFDEAIKVYPGYAEAYLERGGVKSLMGRKEEALQDYENAVRLQPDNQLALSEVQLLKVQLRSGALPAFRGSSLTCSTAVSSSNSAHPVPGVDRLIGKLQQSLGDKRRLEHSGSDSSSSSSAGSDGSRRGKKKKSNKKRHKAEHDSKRSRMKEKKKHKSKKSRHGDEVVS
jgi:tetratricopeptide (TPR) repeat protein